MPQAAQASTHEEREERERRAGGRRLLSFKELKSIKGIPFSKQWIMKLIQQGRFPAPVKPGGGNGYCAWIESEVDEYLDRLVAARTKRATAPKITSLETRDGA